MAQQFPRTRIVAVSNSASQRESILARAAALGIENVDIVTADMAVFDTSETFDRIVSIEMFEHMRNYKLLLERIAGWLEPDGKLFVHIFCHETLSYPFQAAGGIDWMARHFFTGGLMPAFDIFQRFPSAMRQVEQWRVNGTHYEETANAWLDKLDTERRAAESIFARHDDPPRVVQRWRMFSWHARNCSVRPTATEWFVGHYLLEKRSTAAGA